MVNLKNSITFTLFGWDQRDSFGVYELQDEAFRIRHESGNEKYFVGEISFSERLKVALSY